MRDQRYAFKVALHVSVDAWVRTFAVEDGVVNAGAVSFLGIFAERRWLSFLFQRLWNSRRYALAAYPS
jgi:hypothetical protein